MTTFKRSFVGGALKTSVVNSSNQLCWKLPRTRALQLMSLFLNKPNSQTKWQSKHFNYRLHGFGIENGSCNIKLQCDPHENLSLLPL